MSGEEWATVLDAERSEIARRRNNVRSVDPDPPGRPVEPGDLYAAADDAVPHGVLASGATALCISGGGIRSATFALGVLQALAKRDLLKHFDYLSTVSGGGYIGSSLTWLTRKGNGGGLGPDTFPFGTAEPRDRADKDHGRAMMRFLRERGKYLVPGDGITVLSGIAVVIRGILINLFVWVPLLAAVFFVLLQGVEAPELAGIVQAVMPEMHLSVKNGNGFASQVNGFEVIFLVSLVALGYFAGYCLVYSVGTRLLARETDQSRTYRYRRFFEERVKKALPLGLTCFVFGLFPTLVAAVGAGVQGLGVAATLGGIGSALAAARTASNSLPTVVTAQIAGALFIVGILAVSCWWAIAVDGILIGLGPEPSPTDVAVVAASAAAVAIALVAAKLVNVNYISVHRYYRDRLMESFMPQPASIAGNRTEPALDADSTAIQDLWNPGDGVADVGGPYHVVNTNVILVDSAERRYRLRGGDNFFMSPFYCGGDAVGLHETHEISGGHMTLATAMTISGAAANPNAGWAGTGPTRSRVVSWVLALLNIRLGYWIRNPRTLRHDTAGRPIGPTALDHFGSFRHEVLGGGSYREDSEWLQLSDGGHFENLALYEMVRRRVRLALVLDAGADPKFGFADLQNTVRRIGQDFGASIVLGRRFWQDKRPGEERAQAHGANGAGIEHLLEDHDLNRVSSLVPSIPVGFPVGGKVAEHGYVIGVIHYPAVPEKGLEAEQGILVYVKATMIRGLSLETRGYKVDHPEFPHQSTADQFFDDGQFEAYREVGFVVGNDMIGHARLGDLIATAHAG